MNRELQVLPASPLPPLYAAWMDELLAAPIPRETDATCDNCAMLAPPETAPEEAKTFYNPATKCCTFVPDLPNFLAGRILAETDATTAAGRATFVARLRAGLGVTPLGVSPPPRFNVLYRNNSGNLFGRAQNLLCPHYLAEAGGRCGIWRQRNAVCATWHCKYVRGATGLAFWSSLLQLLATIEKQLAQWCVGQFVWDEETLQAILSYNPNLMDADGCDEKANPQTQRALWGRQAGREAEFYRECAQLVDKLSWSEVLAACGAEVALRARLVQAAHAQLISDAIAPRLKAGIFRISALTETGCRVVTYNSNDPLNLTKEVLDALPFFDGRPTAEARANVVARRGARLSDGLLQRLCDFGLLVPTENE